MAILRQQSRFHDVDAVEVQDGDKRGMDWRSNKVEKILGSWNLDLKSIGKIK
jgi:hypothetical protein